MRESWMATIPKKIIVEQIADKVGGKRSLVRDVIQSFLDMIIEELANGNRFEFREFGVFEVVFRKERTALNPKTMRKVKVPAKAVVHFKPGKAMREKVNEAFESGKLGDDGKKN
ncbi:MAG: integration host factor subunit beta [Planctomycetota bacterium]|nr:MAG: integration host factor subunit beta [Planctomycetota bacterium]